MLYIYYNKVDYDGVDGRILVTLMHTHTHSHIHASTQNTSSGILRQNTVTQKKNIVAGIQAKRTEKGLNGSKKKEKKCEKCAKCDGSKGC